MNINDFSIYGNKFKKNKSGYVIYMLTLQYAAEELFVAPIVIQDNDLFPRLFKTKLEAQRYLENEVFNYSSTLRYVGYEIRKITTMSVVKT